MIDIIRKKINLHLYEKNTESDKDNLDFFLLLLDSLSEKELTALYKEYSDEELITESIITLLKKRDAENTVFFFIENLFCENRNIRFLCFTFLFEKNFFTHNEILIEQYRKSEKDPEISCLLDSIFGDMKSKEISGNENGVILTDVLSEKILSTDKNIVMNAAFRIKNVCFPGKKETIIKAIEKSNDVIQNLLYALNTEKIEKEDSEKINSYLKEKIFFHELVYDLKMLNLYDFSNRTEKIWTKRIASLLAAVLKF